MLGTLRESIAAKLLLGGAAAADGARPAAVGGATGGGDRGASDDGSLVPLDRDGKKTVAPAATVTPRPIITHNVRIVGSIPFRAEGRLPPHEGGR